MSLLLTTKQACVMLNCCPATLRKRIMAGELPQAITRGPGKKLFSEDAIRRAVNPSPSPPAALKPKPLIWRVDPLAIERVHYAGRPRQHARYLSIKNAKKKEV